MNLVSISDVSQVLDQLLLLPIVKSLNHYSLSNTLAFKFTKKTSS